MLKVIEGFAIIWAVIGVGYLAGRFSLLGENPQPVLGKLAFWITGPAMMLGVLASADLKAVFSEPLLIASVSAAAAWTAMFLWFRTRGHRANESTIGALTGSYSNVGNLGLPFATFVLGSPAYLVAPMMFQFVVLQPLTVILMDMTTPGRSQSTLRSVGQVLLNPMIWGTGVGIALAATHTQLPELINEPIKLIGQAHVTVLLMGFGLSLVGARLFAEREDRTDVLAATITKLAFMPLVAWALVMILGLRGHMAFVVVVLAALPTAQNVFVTSTRYGVEITHARQSVLLTTVVSAPVMVGLAALLT
jgi:predicted permease